MVDLYREVANLVDAIQGVGRNHYIQLPTHQASVSLNITLVPLEYSLLRLSMCLSLSTRRGLSKEDNRVSRHKQPTRLGIHQETRDASQ